MTFWIAIALMCLSALIVATIITMMDIKKRHVLFYDLRDFINSWARENDLLVVIWVSLIACMIIAMVAKIAVNRLP